MADESPDYAAYSLAELYDARSFVDQHRFPERARQIDEEILRRKAIQELEIQQSAADGRSHQESSATAAKHPAWYLTLGAIGILFGLIGLYHQAHLVFQPLIFDLMEGFYQELESKVDASRPQEEDAENTTFWRVWDAAKRTAHAPPWYRTYVYATGAVGLLCMGTYIVGGIRLALRRRNGVLLLTVSCVASIVLNSVHAATWHLSFAYPLVVLLPNFAGGFVLDSGLLLVLFSMRGSFQELE